MMDVDEDQTVPKFPPELIRRIIDLTSADRRALLSCSLVSRSWVYQSRSHLFRSVFVRDPERNLSNLSEFIDTNPDLPVLIQDLHIRPPQLNAKASVDLHALALILQKLQALHALHIEGVEWVGMESSYDSGLPYDHTPLQSKTVKVLSLQHVKIHASEYLWELFLLLPNIVRLQLFAVCVTKGQVTMGPSKLSLPTTPCLSVLEACAFELCDSYPIWFKFLQQVSSVSGSILKSIDVPSSAGAPVIGSLLSVVGRNLTHFRVDLRSFFPLRSQGEIGAICRLMNLQLCYTLSSLRLAVGIDFNARTDPNHYAVWEAVIALLSSAPFCLREVTVEIEEAPNSQLPIFLEQLEAVPWAKMLQALEDLIELDSLTFLSLPSANNWLKPHTVAELPKENPLRGIIEDKLQVFQTKGMLRFR